MSSFVFRSIAADRFDNRSYITPGMDIIVEMDEFEFPDQQLIKQYPILHEDKKQLLLEPEKKNC
eukprot:CAMPEP_0202968906 /NCGR_PEP_ID=MMETSP1396-20130829/14414_1 /ASSEMBLY_ACC=CAM_ASM_000872 /TAXON_ID= /ORGANISM="Pseudokeronopsis sp., Strain Brazil" /LENGTH=63 /DNA_ID=CAMNT_0049695799 /DNA_START=911 /DNA_END=1102 /DNA_ORIENTATION=+